ncbi:MAG: AAA family ATPase [Spirochaetales bacterium]|nr:AAA family ATPase [Spirochaetales bacterium]
MKPVIIYISGSHQHTGKTITSIGLLSLLTKIFPAEQLGYIKPVGQQVIQLSDGTTIDKDAQIIDKFTEIPALDMKIISPVQLASGFTKEYLSSSSPEEETEVLRQNIFDAVNHLSHKRVIIAEGTGHPGVGGIVGLSNADVSNMLDADILYISDGGIGKALDKIEVDLSYFRFKKSRIRGIIFNKVIPEKIPLLKEYLTEDLINKHYRTQDDVPIQILGYLPQVQSISNPSMNVLKKRFSESRIIGDPEERQWKVPCNNIKVISLVAEYLQPEKYIKPGDVVLIAAGSKNRRSRVLNYAKRMKGTLGGLILTCGESTPLWPEIESQIRESGIPAIYVQEDTAIAEQKIFDAYTNTKIQIFDEEKIRLVNKLFEDHLDFDKFIDTFNLE